MGQKYALLDNYILYALIILVSLSIARLMFKYEFLINSPFH